MKWELTIYKIICNWSWPLNLLIFCLLACFNDVTMFDMLWIFRPLGPLQLFTVWSTSAADGCFCLIIAHFEQNLPKLPTDLPPFSLSQILKHSSEFWATVWESQQSAIWWSPNWSWLVKGDYYEVSWQESPQTCTLISYVLEGKKIISHN